nr:hypothetical protein [Tanacetum cinerariifolium]
VLGSRGWGSNHKKKVTSGLNLNSNKVNSSNAPASGSNTNVNSSNVYDIGKNVDNVANKKVEDVFDTTNTSTNVAIMSTSDTSSNNVEDGLVNVIKSDKSNSIAHVPYANLINGEQSKKAANFRTLVAPAGNGADGKLLRSIMRFLFMGFFWAKEWRIW